MQLIILYKRLTFFNKINFISYLRNPIHIYELLKKKFKANNFLFETIQQFFVKSVFLNSTIILIQSSLSTCIRLNHL